MGLDEIEIVEFLLEMVAAAAIYKGEEFLCPALHVKSAGFCLACVGNSKTDLDDILSTLRLDLLGILLYPFLQNFLISVYLLPSLQRQLPLLVVSLLKLKVQLILLFLEIRVSIVIILRLYFLNLLLSCLAAATIQLDSYAFREPF